MSILYGIGVGPGDPELLTLKAVRILKTADVIACPAKDGKPGTAYEIAKKACPEIGEKEVLALDFPMKKDGLEEAHKSAAEQITEKLEKGCDVAFLTLGDTSFYSGFYYITGLVAEAGFTAEIINGIPSFCAVSAKLTVPLALGDEPVLISPGEYRPCDGTQVIMKAGSRLTELKAEISRDGKTAYLVENCGMPDEHVYRGLEEIPDSVGYFSMLIVK